MTPFGKRAFITGGSRGLGLAAAEALLEAGCAVVINHHRDVAKADAEVKRLGERYPGRIHAIDADVAEPVSARGAVQAAAALLGGLDIVVSNAGICRFAPFLDITDEEWQRHRAINFDGGFYVGQEAAHVMKDQGTGGRIVFTTSVGAFRSNSTQTHYCATKGGLQLLALGMALELAQYGITVNCIAPGWMHTDINDAASRDRQAVEPWLKAHCPVGRLGTPGDIKSAVRFLTAVESAYVNGATISVDGGWNAQL